MADLPNSDIPHLYPNDIIGPGALIPIWNEITGLTEKYPLANLVNSESSQNFKWTSTGSYDTDEFVTWDGLGWLSLVDDNEGNIPTEGAFWTQINKSPSGFVLWQAGAFTQTDVYCLFILDGYLQLFKLNDPTRPYISSDFMLEYANGDWELMSERGYVGIMKVAHGFVVNDVLVNDGVWNKYDSTNGKPAAIVKAVINANLVIVVLLGERIKTFAGLTPGAVYYAQPDATLDVTMTADAIMLAVSATDAIIFPTGGGGGSIALGDLFPDTYFVSPLGNDVTGVKGDIAKPFTPAGAAALAVAGEVISFLPGDYVINTNIGVNGVSYVTFGGRSRITVNASGVTLFGITSTTLNTVIKGEFEFILNGATSIILHLNFTNGGASCVFDFLSANLQSGDAMMVLPVTNGPMLIKGNIVMESTFSGYFARTIAGNGFDSAGTSFEVNIINNTTSGAAFRNDQPFGFAGVYIKCSYVGAGNGSNFNGNQTLYCKMDISARLTHANATLSLAPGAEVVVSGIGKVYLFGSVYGSFSGVTIQTIPSVVMTINGIISNCLLIDDQTAFLSIIGSSADLTVQFTTTSPLLLDGYHLRFAMNNRAAPLIVMGSVRVKDNVSLGTIIDLRASGSIVGNVNGGVVQPLTSGARNKVAGYIKNLNAGGSARCIEFVGNSTVCFLDLDSAKLIPGAGADASIKHISAGPSDEVRVRMFNKSYATLGFSSSGGVGFTFDIGVVGDLIVDANVELPYDV